MTENELTYAIRGCIFNVYNFLGPGLLESAYETALEYEMNEVGLKNSRQIPLPMFYKSIRMDIGYRMDFLVEEKIIIEVKSVEILMSVHHKQLLTYLKLAGLHLGILVNFNTDVISKSIFRKINGY